MKFRLLSAAAATALAAGDPPADPEAGPEPGQGGSDAGAAPAEQDADKPKKTEGQSDASAGAAASVDVVAASDVANLTAAAEAKGVAAERARTKAVFDSDEGKAHSATAAFLLATSDAPAADIIGHLKGLAPAGKTEATSATIPDTKTNIKTDPAAIAGEQGGSADVDRSWDDVLDAQAAAHAPIVPAAAAAAAAGAPTITAPALPRTGN